MKAIHVVEVSRSSLAGEVAQICAAYVLDPTKPVLALATSKDSLKISGRGTLKLVADGLDLAEALRIASAEVEGYGGGHPVASGATIPASAKKQFLARMDEIVAGQLGGN